jgi:hypothetical protein
LLTRVKRESLGKYEAEPRRLSRLFTLHDASLEAHMDAAVHNVNENVRNGWEADTRADLHGGGIWPQAVGPLRGCYRSIAALDPAALS